MRNKVSNFLNNIFFERFIIVLIFLNLIIFIFQTDSTVNAALGDFFNYVEIFSIIVFTIEYLLRCLTLSNFKELFGIYMLIDLAAILPFYLSFITVNTVFLRVLRLVRLLRIAKVARYSNAVENIKSAFVKRKNELIITGIIFGIAVFCRQLACIMLSITLTLKLFPVFHLLFGGLLLHLPQSGMGTLIL